MIKMAENWKKMKKISARNILLGILLICCQYECGAAKKQQPVPKTGTVYDMLDPYIEPMARSLQNITQYVAILKKYTGPSLSAKKKFDKKVGDFQEDLKLKLQKFDQKHIDNFLKNTETLDAIVTAREKLFFKKVQKSYNNILKDVDNKKVGEQNYIQTCANNFLTEQTKNKASCTTEFKTHWLILKSILNWSPYLTITLGFLGGMVHAVAPRYGIACLAAAAWLNGLFINELNLEAIGTFLVSGIGYLTGYSATKIYSKKPI